MLPKGLKLFYADVIDPDDGYQCFFYVVARNECTALDRFHKDMRRSFYRYEYYFDEVDDGDKEKVSDFLRWHPEAKAGVYRA